MTMRSAGALLMISIAASGQQKGQYILGSNGLNAGVMPAPGFTYANQGTIYRAFRLKGPDGEPVPVSGSVDLKIDQNLFMYTSKKISFLGGTYGGFFDLIIANASITAPVFGVTVGGAGVTDIYVEPFGLGYHYPRIDFKVAYGFIAPTGRYNPNPLLASNNIGSGYWGHDISFGSTIYLTKNKGTQLSTFSLYEFHGKKRFSDIRPGQTYNLEWGLGQMLPAGKNFLQIGAVGYGQWQTTATSGSVPVVIRESRYGVASIGPQATFIVPKWNFSAFFRWELEFGATARVEGATWSFGSAISFPVTR